MRWMGYTDLVLRKGLPMKTRYRLSLVEIIVVVIILGLLIAALIPGPAAK